MTLSNELTWQLNVNQGFTGGSAAASMESTLLALKNSLIGFASSPWTVAGSSNKTVAAMDGVDRWSTTTDLQWTSTGIRPWIVLEQAGMNGLQLLLSAPKISGTIPTMYWSVSPSGGFTGGNVTPASLTTNMPSATDEQILLSNAIFLTTSTTRNILHVWQSSTGSCTRWCIYTPSTSRFANVTMLETVKEPVTGWAIPYFFYTSAAVNPAMAASVVTNGFGIHGGTKYAAGLSWESYASGATPLHVDEHGSINRITNQFGAYPMGVVSMAVGMRGKHGVIYDSWWGPGILKANNIDPYFSTLTFDSNTFVQIDEMIWPWNGASGMTIV